MCGIVGIVNPAGAVPVEEGVLRRMLGAVRHRGPDEFGIYRDDHAGLGSARLSIIDLSGGTQPITNEDGRLWIVFNGEIFNYPELRCELEARGHRFATQTDTEVILHLYEDLGPECLGRLNGQFAIAVWDKEQRELFLARDRLGIRPLFYALRNGRLVFGSEIKSLLATPWVQAEIDSTALRQVFTYWSTLSPRTAFREVSEIPPAHYALARGGTLTVARYWELDFMPDSEGRRTEEEYREELESLLIDACRLRLRADVPVGAYLSGGLDSSLTAAVVRRHTGNRLDTFSIAFENPDFDESAFQLRMAGFLGTEHRVVRCTHADIARVFPDVVRHAETPILRTAPAPLYLLSGLVRDHRLKVVLTGEGADEILGGYDIFKEMKIRRFWARNPESRRRPLLLRRLYPDIGALGAAGDAYRNAFFGRDLTNTDDPFYSHLLRWRNTARCLRFLVDGGDGRESFGSDIVLPDGFRRWPPLGRAQYLEATIFLSQYLLSSQGDRMAMAHSVEGRHPFLDYRVVEYAGRLPVHLKMRALTEKFLLRQIGRRLLPAEIWRRPKRPYRAPVHRSFFPDTPAYVAELLSERELANTGIFRPAAVTQLVYKARNGGRLSEIEDMALAGILSTQLLYRQFVRDFRSQPLSPAEKIKIVDAAVGAAAR